MKTVFRSLLFSVVTLTTLLLSVNKISAHTTYLTSGGTSSSVAVSGITKPIGWTNATSAILSNVELGPFIGSNLRNSNGWRSSTAEELITNGGFIVPKYFKSIQTGNFNSTSTWSESTNGTTWVPATSTPTVDDLTVIIENSHIVTVSASVTSDEVTINSGGQVTVSSGQIWTIANGTSTDLTVNGTVLNSGTITLGSSPSVVFNSGSTYNHAVNGGVIPDATWNENSLCTITGITDQNPTGLDGKTFFNLTYNSTSQTGEQNMDQGFTVQNDFKILSTGSGSLRLVDQPIPRTITTKNFEMTTGAFFLSSGNAIGTLNVSGNFTHSGGLITEDDLGSGSIVFNGTTPQIFTSGNTATVSFDIDYTVNNNAILQMADESTVVNGRSFTLSAGGTLDIKSVYGITKNTYTGNGPTAGNIRPLSRTFSTSANYIYSGGAQSVGDGLKGAIKLTLSGTGTKTFVDSNFTAVSNTSLPVAFSLSIASGVVLSIPADKVIEVSGQLFIAGVGQSNGSYGSTTSNATFKDNTYFTATTGIVNAALSALPVTLSNFTAKQTTDSYVSLAWVTSSESSNKGFSIERQEETNGKFQSLGFIPSKAEGGNSQTTLAYSFKDMTAKKGSNRYRLVQEDLDGKKTYSEVRVVKLTEQSVSNVYPNPSTGAINISRSNDGKKMNLQVLDQSGRVISQVNNIIDANYRMNLPKPGIYTIKMTYPETGEQSLQRIVVQK